MFSRLSRLVGALPAARIPPSLAAPWLYAGRATPELRLVRMRRRWPRCRRECWPHASPAILAVGPAAQLARINVPLVVPAREGGPAGAGIRRARNPSSASPMHSWWNSTRPIFLLQTEPEACAVATRAFIQRCQR
jgi:hypothetical protein